ncbi:hypothetical protein SAMN05661091_3774 [Paenibacillus uliginis N3/975]|uniref:Uncharacterized protein n=1 Tax=Paenibacillus uliginis N3/975 TaxID=1313296 RepID=A0A1X7HJ28_9BACL|nr:hypothetical protein SAMN05661091_3774 [Paenibacillus uliginis N3/975]
MEFTEFRYILVHLNFAPELDLEEHVSTNYLVHVVNETVNRLDEQLIDATSLVVPSQFTQKAHHRPQNQAGYPRINPPVAF